MKKEKIGKGGVVFLTASGAALGAVLGAVAALNFRMKVRWTALAGAVIGGAIAYHNAKK